jgi:dolichyl-phosphate-mannose--protein O-mannosyl transferase
MWPWPWTEPHRTAPFYTADIAYGSVVTIKSVSAKPPCWLHSHRDRYPQYYDKGTTKQRVSSAQVQ